MPVLGVLSFINRTINGTLVLITFGMSPTIRAWNFQMERNVTPTSSRSLEQLIFTTYLRTLKLEVSLILVNGSTRYKELIRELEVTSVAGNAYVAYGTGIVCHTINTYPAPPNAVGDPAANTLYRYLITLSFDSVLIFTGHSLGGALSPTVALTFKLARILRVTNILTYPTTGPTVPGSVAKTKVSWRDVWLKKKKLRMYRFQDQFH